MNIGNECKNCQFDESNVIKSITIKGKILRERSCKQCKHHYFTVEIINCPVCHTQDSKVYQTDKKESYFERKRICTNCLSIYRTFESTEGEIKYNQNQYKAIIVSTNTDIIKHFTVS